MTAEDADLLERLRQRLPGLETAGAAATTSDFDLDPDLRPLAPRRLTPAAVLIGLVERADGLRVVLTQRTADMPTHAGQVAFPGGRVQADDPGPVAAALREAHEEVGLHPSFVRPFAAMPAYETVTGFQVAPVLALVSGDFVATPDPREVAAVFEPPVRFVFDPGNLERHSRMWNGRERHFYAMSWQDRVIWGATAGMIKAIQDRVWA
jgi:8-oxo-dGTP pyrophosphatase MutT (NUDIX family)